MAETFNGMIKTSEYSKLPVIYGKEWTLMEIIWNYPEGITMRALVKKGAEKGWQRTTVYTMVGRLKQRGIVSGNDERSHVVYANYTLGEMRRDNLRYVLNRFYSGDMKRILDDLRILEEEKRK